MPNDETIKAMKECGKISQNDDIVEANNVANISKILQAMIKEIIF